MAFNFSPKVVTDGLVLYLDASNIKSYPGSGTDWFDLTRESNNGVLNNGPTFSSSNLGSIVFDGNNDYVSVDNNNTLLPNQLTLSIWLNRSQLGNYSQVVGVPLDDVTWSNPFRRYGFEFIADTNTMSFTLGFDDNTYVSTTCETFGVDTWFNITGTYDGSNINVYVNGQLSATSSETKTLINSTSKFYLGAENSSTTYPFGGKVGCVNLYNRPLDPSEVLQNYNALKTKFGL